MKELCFATNNAHKVAEVQAKIGSEFSIKTLNELGCTADIPETADTLEGNALQKARYIWSHYHCNCFADDTGLEVEALNGAPGVHTARYAGDSKDNNANMAKLLSALDGKENRRACFRTVIALIEEGKETLFEGKVEGIITTKKSGSEGFGYDPVFQPTGYDKTFAELPLAVKNSISHRGRAVEKLIEHLKNQ
ncbi:MAG: non-canonical purine NTP diphosphatase [Paludibacteraceae bacterium]|nr:non-canonical purine NTP diphosphatase [Paludibacteraceae bacterium]MBR6043885.1 non-canonical purine NTP diphosphatase [Paludibacteraceae bacterium]MCR5568347.1 non-canonical purine NTP diphosphatase [Paludibacteraceae bacterium]